MQDFGKDALAGLTVAVVLIPQSMAYAMLAGLPPVFGLYAAGITPLIAGLWGSLRQLATGPIAIMSLLVLTTLTPFADPGSREYIELSYVLAFMVGGFYIFLGVCRMGIVMAYLSHSSVQGFTAAAALIIIGTQLPHFLGISVGSNEYIFPMFMEIISKIPELNPPTLGLGLLSFFIISIIKKYHKTLPAGLIALVLATSILIFFRLDQHGVVIVGKVHKGLPYFHIPGVSFELLSRLFGPVVVISLVSFAEAYAVGKSIAVQTKQKVDVNQELIGQGLANLIGSFFQSYPVSGSFSRTAINYAAGAKTGISSVVSSFIVIISLLFLTPLFTYIPRTALAALVIHAVLLLFNPSQVFKLWKMNRHDGIAAITVFVLGLIAKPDYALLIGVIMSLMFFLWKTMHPRVVRITKDPERNMFLNGDAYNKPSCPQILHLRSDSEIYFGNAEFLMEHMLNQLDRQTGPVKFILLDFQAVGFIDITGIDELRIFMEDTQERGVQTAFVSVHIPVMNIYKSSGLINEIDPVYIFDKRGTALSSLFSRIDHDYCRNSCPYKLFNECSSLK